MVHSRGWVMACLIAFVSIGAAHAATLVGADYGGADLVPADGDVLEGTFTNVGTFHVPVDVHVQAQSRVPLVVEADTILVEGVLDGEGKGFKGGLVEHPGNGPGGGGRTRFAGGGGAGGGYGGRGGHGGSPSDLCHADGVVLERFVERAGGPIYGSHDDPLDAPFGSGGASTDCGEDPVPYGGAGGGSVTLRATAITVAATGAVSVQGQRGSAWAKGGNCDQGFEGGPGSGGGSGGSLVLDGSSVQIEGRLIASGGHGGRASSGYNHADGGGGGGGGGRIKIFGTTTLANQALIVGGANGGSGDGSDSKECNDGWQGGRGTIYVDSLVTGPPSIAVAGVCGAVTLTVSGGTPYGNVDLVMGGAAGTDIVPGGVCAGLTTGLSDPRRVVTRTLDESGSLEAGSGIGPSCGNPIQVIDLWSCTASPVVTLP